MQPKQVDSVNPSVQRKWQAGRELQKASLDLRRSLELDRWKREATGAASLPA